MTDSDFKIGIAGLGLLGGSLGMALRGKCRRLGWARRRENRELALRSDAVDEVFDSPAQLIGEADLTVIALPVEATERFIIDYAAVWPAGAVVTDVGSLKGGIMKCAAEHLTARGVFFIGSHPMAGTEKSGLDAAFPELYRNADVFVVPAEGVPETAVAAVEKMWSAAGGHPYRINASEHDQLVARTSHVLHILASALTRSILGAAEPEMRKERFRGCATGFRDCCRIASSSPAMWREIIEKNRSAVLKAMDDFETSYARMRHQIESGDFDGFEQDFREGKALRDSWMEYKKRSEKK